MRPNHLVWLLLAACGGPREAEDVARICLEDPLAEYSSTALEADAPLVIHAEAVAGCHTDALEVSCEAQLDGDTVRVTALTTWVRTEPLATNCEAIAFFAHATCETEPLAAGTYTLDYSGKQLSFDVPGPATGCIDP